MLLFDNCLLTLFGMHGTMPAILSIFVVHFTLTPYFLVCRGELKERDNLKLFVSFWMFSAFSKANMIFYLPFILIINMYVSVEHFDCRIPSSVIAAHSVTFLWCKSTAGKFSRVLHM